MAVRCPWELAKGIRNKRGKLYSGLLTHEYLRGPPEVVVWIYDTFDNNLEIENGFTKYLKESCR